MTKVLKYNFKNETNKNTIRVIHDLILNSQYIDGYYADDKIIIGLGKELTCYNLESNDINFKISNTEPFYVSHKGLII